MGLGEHIAQRRHSKNAAPNGHAGDGADMQADGGTLDTETFSILHYIL